MMDTQELLCIISVIGYFIPLCGFLVRYTSSRWSTYLFFAFFCVLRIVCYALGAYYNSPAVVYPSIRYIQLYIAKITLNAIGAVVMMISIGELYKSIIPKIHHHHNHVQSAFERFAFHHIRIPFLPFAGCLIAGCIFANPTYSLEAQNSGLILRKLSIVLLLALNTLFMYISATHSYRYPIHKSAFAVTFTSTAFFTLAVIYNVVITYNASASIYVWPAYVFGPLVEVMSLAILSVDLQTYFLGRERDTILSDEKEQV
ncbi:hypothetical protein CPC16_011127 [Podila verticillata]|nr:hypothetical protein BGZ59_002082 [Podila verticillata]KAF9378786.1 hypothetical protein CPC16_011127 [Podila verticillata]KAI9236470.1 MAG: hypothetical protein BYD32DRAFT_437436 [Podila humilis]KFH65186.1 hypothetical protein MVEG_08667 [Podila verticillata NRRL 6337]